MDKLRRFFSKINSSSGFFLMLIVVFIYFSFYAIRGDRGLLKYLNLSKEVADARQISEKYALEKQEWADKVKRLSPESLDLDTLDEQVRVVLNMVGPKEFVILDSDLDE